MKISNYIKDRVVPILFSLLILFSITIILFLFNINSYLIILINLILLMNYFIIFLYSYYRKRKFYNSLIKSLNSLDKKYLITEIITKPDFNEGIILTDILYEIDKSMIENINKYKFSIDEFKEYLELWCHEIKTPISTTNLIIDNNYNEVTKSIKEELDKIENYVEQVLYYSRSDSVKEDYIINEINLKKVIEKVIKRNKKQLINKKIKVNIKEIYNIKSDQKWLEFIINQIIINCIKYSKNKDSNIEITMKKNNNSKILSIEDNGIGIEKEDISRVFDKGFTGSNGRKKYSSTGIGLYLCKKLCLKLGHDITIDSKINTYTRVDIIFPNNSLTEVVNITKM